MGIVLLFFFIIPLGVILVMMLTMQAIMPDILVIPVDENCSEVTISPAPVAKEPTNQIIVKVICGDQVIQYNGYTIGRFETTGGSKLTIKTTPGEEETKE